MNTYYLIVVSGVREPGRYSVSWCTVSAAEYCFWINEKLSLDERAWNPYLNQYYVPEYEIILNEDFKESALENLIYALRNFDGKQDREFFLGTNEISEGFIFIEFHELISIIMKELDVSCYKSIRNYRKERMAPPIGGGANATYQIFLTADVVEKRVIRFELDAISVEHAVERFYDLIDTKTFCIEWAGKKLYMDILSSKIIDGEIFARKKNDASSTNTIKEKINLNPLEDSINDEEC